MLKRKDGWEKAKAAEAKRKRKEILEKKPSSLNYWNRPANITSVDINFGSAGEDNSLAQNPSDQLLYQPLHVIALAVTFSAMTPTVT